VRAGNGITSALVRAFCPQAAAMRLTWPAVGRKPPATFRTEGARAGNGIARALAEPFARSLPPRG